MIAPIYYLSPHADDVAFSSGGSVALDVAAGRPVTLITVFLSGQDASQRRDEDEKAAAVLGCAYQSLDLAEVLDRPSGGGRFGIFAPLGPAHLGITQDVVTELRRHISGPAELRAPLAVGGHIDHRIVHAAARTVAEKLGPAGKLAFYEDQPYSLAGFSVGRRLDVLHALPRPSSAVLGARPVGCDRGWLLAEIAAYRALLLSWPALRGGLPGLRQLHCHLIAHRAVRSDRSDQHSDPPRQLHPLLRDVSAPSILEQRRQAIRQYDSQWPSFAGSLPSLYASLDAFGRRYGDRGQICERLWHGDPVEA